MPGPILPRTVLFHKNSVQQITLACERYRGDERVDIREYADYNASGEFKPTKKGINFTANSEHLRELIDQLIHIQNELEAREANAA